MCRVLCGVWGRDLGRILDQKLGGDWNGTWVDDPRSFPAHDRLVSHAKCCLTLRAIAIETKIRPVHRKYTQDPIMYVTLALR